MCHRANMSHTPDCDTVTDRVGPETDSLRLWAMSMSLASDKSDPSTSGLDQPDPTKASMDQKLSRCQLVAFTWFSNGLPNFWFQSTPSNCNQMLKLIIFRNKFVLGKTLAYRLHDFKIDLGFCKCFFMTTWLDVIPFFTDGDLVPAPSSPHPGFLQICRCLHFSLPTCSAENKYFAGMIRWS